MSFNGAEHMRLKNEILLYLSSSGVFVWNNPTGKFYTHTGAVVSIGIKGAPDILGVCRNGCALAIEVKTGAGRLSQEQVNWRKRFTQSGGIYVLARRVEDVAAL